MTEMPGISDRVPSHSPPAWRTTYESFERRRKNDAPGRVEILLDRSDGNMPERRRLEADMVAKRILSLVDGRRDTTETPGASDRVPSPAGPLLVFEKQGDIETPRLCDYGDIAILMRKRTHLGILTDALHRHGIPFITVGGEGFFSEPEVCHLKSLLSFLVDPADGFALYAVLRGPLFSVPERDLLLAASDGTAGAGTVPQPGASDALGLSRAVLLDISGRKVMGLRSGSNDVRHLAPGVHFLRIEDGSPPQKLIIQR
jgi:hypothetical protein